MFFTAAHLQGFSSERSFLIHLLYCRYRNVTIWARVQPCAGLNVVSVIPLVIPFSTAHSTASV